MEGVPERESVPTEYTWDLEAIYDTRDAWEADVEAVQEALEELRAYEGRLDESPETLLEALELRDELHRMVERVAAYARMRSDEDTRKDEYQALSTRATSLSAEVSSTASFIEPEIQHLPEERVESMITTTEDLEVYDHYLDDVLRRKQHTRSAEVEALLSDLGEVLGAPNDIYGMLTDADLTFPSVEDPDGSETEITLSNLTTLLQNRDRDFRKDVYETFFEELSTLRNTIGTALKHQVKTDVKLATAREYETTRQAALDDANIPVEVYDALVETVESNLDALHRHVDLKAHAHEVDELAMWDIYAPIAAGESPEIEYEEATEMVVEAMAPLGEEYQTRVAEGLESRWVDVYENRGKRSGAYSGGTYDTQPYILLNWQKDISSLFTLAHELGHSLHSELASESQPYIYGSYEIFVAEVASTVNETLLTEHLLETHDDERFRRHVLDQFLERIRSTLFRQTMFAAFEHRIHTMSESGEPLTPDRLDEAYGELKETYYEPAAMDEHIRSEWMRIPHFFYNYYVYQYATGLSAAIAIVNRIQNERESAAEDYLDALRLGGSEYPLDILETAGVDMASPEPIATAIETYEDKLDQMATILE